MQHLKDFMQSGCQHSQGVPTPESPQDNIPALVPVVHLANGMQTNMVANQYPGELSVTCLPGQRQQGYAQTQQKFHRLHHCQNSSAIPQISNHLFFTAGTGSIALEENRPRQDEHSSSVTKKKISHPLLDTTLKQNSMSFNTIQCLINAPSSPTVETNTNIEPNSSNFPDEKHETLQVKHSLAAPSCENPRKKKLDHSQGTNFTCDQLQISFPSGQPPNVPPTDDQIWEFIEKRIAPYRAASTQHSRKNVVTFSNMKSNNCTEQKDATLQSDCNMPETNRVDLPTTSVSHEDVQRQLLNFSLTKQYIAAGSQVLKENSSKSHKESTALTLKSKEAGDCTTVASKKHSSGTLTLAVEHSQNASKNEPVKKKASIDYMSVKKHLDVASVNSDGKLVYLDDCGGITFVGSSDEKFYSTVDNYIENGMAPLHYSLTALKELISSLENVEIIAKVDNFSEVILQKYWKGDVDNVHLFTSTEYPQIMMNIAATCTKNEDKSPVVLTAVSGMIFDEPTMKPICSSQSPWLNMNMNLDDIDKEPGLSWASKSTTNQEKEGTDPKAVETVRLHSEGVTEISEEFQTKTCPVVSENNTSELTLLTENDVNTEKEKNTEDPQRFQITCKEITEHSEKKSSIQIFNVMSLGANHSCEGMMRDVHTQSEFSVEFSHNKVTMNHKEPCPDKKTHSLDYLKDPQYEDISDDDKSQMVANQPCLKDIQYEDKNKEEDLQNVAVDSSLTQVSKNNKRSTFEHEGHGHMLDQAQMKVISDEQLVPEKQLLQKTETVDTAKHFSSIAFTGFAETHNGFEHLSNLKCDSKKDLGPSSVLKDETDQMDGEDDDDWMVIPVIGDVEFEPEETAEEQGDLESVVLHHEETEVMERWGFRSPKQCRLHQTTQDPLPAATSSQIEVFDTLDCFVKAKSVHFGFYKSAILNKPNPKGDLHTAENRRESYSETEDSCDYSPASEHNYLTVPRQLLKETLAPASSDTDDSLSGKVTEHKVTKTQKGQTRHLHLHKLKELVNARARSKTGQLKTNRQKVSEKDEVIILDSDTDDEIDEQVDHAINKPDDLTQQSIIIHDSDTEDETDQNYKKGNKLNMSSWPVDSGNTRKSGQPTEAKGHIQQETERFNKRKGSRSTTLKRNSCDSDKVLKKDYIYKKKPSVEKTVSSGSEDSSTTSFPAQNSLTADTVQCSYGTSGKKPQKTALSSKDSADKLPQSVGKNTGSTNQAPNPVIPRLFVENASESNCYLKLSKNSRVVGKGDTQAPKTPTSTKSPSENDRHCATNNKHQTKAKKSRLASGKISLSSRESSSTSASNSAEIRLRSASESMSQSVGTSALTNLPKTKPGPSVPTHPFSSNKLKLSHSYSNPSTLDHCNTHSKDLSCSTTTQSFAKKRVRNDWRMSYVPTNIYRKLSHGRHDLLRSISCDSRREARPGPSHKSRAPRKRHSSQKSETPLIKKLKLEAIQRTKDINRTTSSEQSNVVGKDYKWAEKQRPTKVTSS